MTSFFLFQVECDGLLISFSLKLVLLLLATWAIFYRRPKATMPRIHLYRGCVIALLLVVTATFWLFYLTRMTSDQRRLVEYYDVVQFSESMVDALLFVQYLAVVLIEVRHLTPEFYVKVVRSPDGESRAYSVGALTVQRAAAWVLERYYVDFPIYNPYLERIPPGPAGPTAASATAAAAGAAGKRKGNLKYYDIDGYNIAEEKVEKVTHVFNLETRLCKK